MILAAAGGVGHLACQFALLKGADVIATASKRHHSFLKELGVEKIIDYTEEKVSEVCQDVDCVLDLVGGEAAWKLLRALKRAGFL